MPEKRFSYGELREKQYLVKRRLALVTKLKSLKEFFKDEKEMFFIEENEWGHPYQDYQALRYYLLLTCFDILGQPADWKDYGSWLNAKNNAERDLILEQHKDVNPLEFSKLLYARYIEIYGTKNSFYRFINEIISPERKAELLKSINIRKFEKPSMTEIQFEQTDEEKLKFLLFIRNSHTHTGLTIGSPGGAMLSPDYDFEENGIWHEGRRKYGYHVIHYEFKGTTLIQYSVRRWPALLTEIIEEALER